MKFAVVYEYPADQDLVQRARPAHREYLTRLQQQGKLAMAGPFPDGSGALIVYEAERAADVPALIEADPFYEAGVFRGWTIKP
jgi:uncharacterized protein